MQVDDILADIRSAFEFQRLYDECKKTHVISDCGRPIFCEKCSDFRRKSNARVAKYRAKQKGVVE